MMGKIHSHFPLGVLLPCLLTTCFAMPRTNITTDQSALLALKAHITNEPHQILSKNWSVGTPVCEWIGVTCGARHRRVTSLNLSNMNLTGTIPPQFGNLSFLVSLDMSSNKFHGELPNEFSLFRRLKVLNLLFNNFRGQLPHWIGSFDELEHLYLGNNSFSGLIPPSISNMSKLATLILSGNSLQGHIPAEIFNITSLEIINLIYNTLSGSLPDNICQHLPRLNQLSLSWNELSGQIPSSLGQCLDLQSLYLAFNQFTGAIPKEIGNLKALEWLGLGGNSLEGAIPKTIGNLTLLTGLDFQLNNLTGEIPKETGNLTMLTILYLDKNNITGVIPGEMGNLHKVEEIVFAWNKLTGLFPIEIFNLSTIRVISITSNQISGYLPSTIGHSLPNLEGLYFYNNNFSGVIPNSISNSSKLNTIDLSTNNFAGLIPNSLGELRQLKLLNLFNNNLMSDPSSPELSFITSLTNCKDLVRLGLSINPLNGILPNSVGNLSTSIEILTLDSCKVKGIIPREIGNLSSLIYLSLADNQFTGSLPNTVTHLREIQRVFLGWNKISISLHYFCSCQNLGDLHLEDNHILGTIPECFGNITSMRYLNLQSNKLNGSLPSDIWNLKDLLELDLSSNLLSGSLHPQMENLKMATMINLSMNHFSGGIPITIGGMENLRYLYLDNNILQGSIPESMSKMMSLEGLDLSHNLLSGSIPKSLETLQYLTYFNVSFNNLSGEIPSGGPFTKFTVESFISNQGLCGAQRFHVPPCPTISFHSKSRTKMKHLIIFVSLGVIILAAATSVGFVYLRYQRKDKTLNDETRLSMVTHERISFYQLLHATDGYNEINLLGTGSFGSVYKGTLDDGRTVAIKVFNLQTEGSFESFDAECKMLCNLRHRNLTKAISSCSNPDFRALILEYMPNGSLEKWLYSQNYSLNIMQRLEILIDVACALQYLHCENLTPVVHCDLKPSNVLLDQDMVAHVSDFGVAKLLGHDDSFTFTKTLATLCYLAPEYGLEGLVSTKCDIYSFGIMMMEVFTSVRPNDEMFGENLNLKSWAQDSLPNKLAHIIDANLLRETEEQHVPEIMGCISSIMELALTCTEEIPRERSNIQAILAALNKIKLQLLPYKESLEGVREVV